MQAQQAVLAKIPQCIQKKAKQAVVEKWLAAYQDTNPDANAKDTLGQRRTFLTQVGSSSYVPKMPEAPIEDQKYILRYEGKQWGAWAVKWAGGVTSVSAILLLAYNRYIKG